MYKLLATLILSVFLLEVNAQKSKWIYDVSHAKVGFRISHFGISETEGKFTRFDGHVLSEMENFSDADIYLKIDAASINTEEEKRDEHLRSPDFFDIEKYPEIVFKSSEMKKINEDEYAMRGDLTMHGITKEIVLNVKYRGTVLDPFGNTKAGFTIAGNIDRTEWGLDWNGTLAAGGLLVGNDVDLDINIELQKL